MTRVSIVTNIPAPYRNHLFGELASQFSERGWQFEVLYMARSEPHRRWQIDPDEMSYPHRFFPNRRCSFGDVHLHWNFSLLRYLRSASPDILIVGGYNGPTHVAAPRVTKRETIRLLWSESNLQSGKVSFLQNSLAKRLKAALLAGFDGFVVPGERSRDLITSLRRSAMDSRFLRLPNVVDPSVFRDQVAAARVGRSVLRQKFNLPPEAQVWVCPARLERFKGLGELLPLLRGVNNVRLLIAGTGSLEAELRQQALNHNVHVDFVGHCTQSQMVELYAAADVFVLPSLQDPSPLSPIEALAASLPLFVSQRIGNVEEVLECGNNGWEYKLNPQLDAETAREISRTPTSELRRLGERSLQRYGQVFETSKVVQSFIDELQDLHQQLRTRGENALASRPTLKPVNGR